MEEDISTLIGQKSKSEYTLEELSIKALLGFVLILQKQF